MSKVNKQTTLREEISEILIKWSMPTRQIAITEIESLFQKQMEEKVKELEGLNKPLTHGVDMVTKKYYNDAISDAQEVLKK